MKLQAPNEEPPLFWDFCHRSLLFPTTSPVTGKIVLMTPQRQLRSGCTRHVKGLKARVLMGNTNQLHARGRQKGAE